LQFTFCASLNLPTQPEIDRLWYYFHPDAEEEFDRGVEYYEECQTGLGLEFAKKSTPRSLVSSNIPMLGEDSQRTRAVA
jgi:hypothetical protein